MKIYLAGPLFSEAERDWMSKLKGQIESFASKLGHTAQVVWPYRERISCLADFPKASISSCVMSS